MDNRLLVAAGTLGGLAVGAVGGYYFAKRRLEGAFVEAVEEEVAATEHHFRMLNKIGEYSSPEEMLQRRNAPEPVDYNTPVEGEPSTEDIEKTLNALRKWDTGENAAIIKKNGYGEVLGQPSPSDIRSPRLRPGDPYPISEDAFLQNDDDYEQVSLTWYGGDPEPTLAGSDDDVEWEPNYALGRELTLEDFGSETILYFRNPRSKHDFEVNLSEHSYSEFVTGASDHQDL